MNPKEQRIAIAEACGRTISEKIIRYPNGTENGRGNTPSYIEQKFRNYRRQGIECELVDVESAEDGFYPTNDLNAMHEAEKVLGGDQRFVYWHNLNKIVLGTLHVPFATAAQRAEAFLKTIGKWEESK